VWFLGISIVALSVTALLPAMQAVWRAIAARRQVERLGGRIVTRESGQRWMRKLLGSECAQINQVVVRVDLGGQKVYDDDLACLQWLPEVEVLYLERTQITDDGMKYLNRLPNLRVIDLGVTEVGDNGIAVLEQLPGLERINLAYTRVTSCGIDALIPRTPQVACQSWAAAECYPGSNASSYG
jgi:hypothetical protein